LYLSTMCHCGIASNHQSWPDKKLGGAREQARLLCARFGRKSPKHWAWIPRNEYLL